MENGGKDCFDACKKQGRCDWCGMDGFCCRKDRIGNGCDGTFGGQNHQCVLKPGNVFLVSSISSKKQMKTSRPEVT